MKFPMEGSTPAAATAEGASRFELAPPRRFILLPEESVNGQGRRPRIRRYRLTSVGQGPCASRADIAMARIASELGCTGRM